MPSAPLVPPRPPFTAAFVFARGLRQTLENAPLRRSEALGDPSGALPQVLGRLPRRLAVFRTPAAGLDRPHLLANVFGRRNRRADPSGFPPTRVLVGPFACFRWPPARPASKLNAVAGKAAGSGASGRWRRAGGLGRLERQRSCRPAATLIRSVRAAISGGARRSHNRAACGGKKTPSMQAGVRCSGTMRRFPS